MDQNYQNAIALFLARPSKQDPCHAATKQDLLRFCAEKAHLHIVAFVAIPKISLERFYQSLDLAAGYKAQAIIIDEASTLFLPPKELPKFIRFLSERKLILIIATTGAIFLKEHLESLCLLLNASNKALNEQRGRNIKNALKQKKAQGLKIGGKRFGENEDESAIIKQIIDLYNTGKSLQNICDLLVANDIKSARAKIWHPTTVKRIIERKLRH